MQKLVKNLELKATTLVTTSRHQSTIAQPVAVSGFGFWSGLDVTVQFRPAAENSGLVFVRTDMPDRPRIDAAIRNRIPGPRRTTLEQNGHAVEMVEHVLAALAGLQIDNCELHVNRAEMPGLDGSSEPFVNALQTAGRTIQKEFHKVLVVRKPVRVECGNAWIQALPGDRRVLELTYELDYPAVAVIGAQSFSAQITPAVFIREIASARTFLLESEAIQLQQQGLGDRVTFRDVLVFGEGGPIENGLRFPEECARHKMLDMIGDFALAGHDLVGKFTASKSGHLLNSQMVDALLQQNINSLPNRQSA